LLIIMFSKDRRKIETSDFYQAWREILQFKENNKAEECPHFIRLEDEQGRLVLLALYDEDRWALETLDENWGTEFGRIDQARDLKVQESLLTDEESRKTLETFMAEGLLTIPSK
jgi:hypothetical protein